MMRDNNGNQNIHSSDTGVRQDSKGLQQQIQPERLFLILWRHAWIIFLVTVIAIVGGVVYIVKSPPIYESTSRVYVEQTGPRIMTEDEGLFMASKNYLYTQAELITATPILSDALKNCQAYHLRTLTDVDNHIEFLKRNLQAQVGKKDDILNISILSPYPEEAAQIVNTVVDSYITFHSIRKRSTSSEVLKILQKEKTKRSEELTQRLHALIDYKKQHETLAFQSHNGNMILNRMQVLSTELTRAELQTMEARSVYETASKMMNDEDKIVQFIKSQQTINRMGADPDLTRLKAEPEILKKRRSNRLRELTEDHPAVLAIDIEIERIHAQIKEIEIGFAQGQLAVLEQAYRIAQEQEQQIRLHFEEYREQVIALNEQVAQYTLLESEYEQTKRLSDILDERIRELHVTEDTGALNITILEAAQPALKPSQPQKERIMAMALILGLMA
ncbi:GumC family protein, partial [Planctomycetota bacterium]